jgi:hypothetical protein
MPDDNIANRFDDFSRARLAEWAAERVFKPKNDLSIHRPSIRLGFLFDAITHPIREAKDVFVLGLERFFAHDG